MNVLLAFVIILALVDIFQFALLLGARAAGKVWKRRFESEQGRVQRQAELIRRLLDENLILKKTQAEVSKALCALLKLVEKNEKPAQPEPQKQPPVDNEHVAPGCEQFTPETIAAAKVVPA